MPESQGYLRPYVFDPYTQGLKALTPVSHKDAYGPPPGSKDGGLMKLANGGAVAFADGGTSFVAGGGDGQFGGFRTQAEYDQACQFGGFRTQAEYDQAWRQKPLKTLRNVLRLRPIKSRAILVTVTSTHGQKPIHPC